MSEQTLVEKTEEVKIDPLKDKSLVELAEILDSLTIESNKLKLDALEAGYDDQMKLNKEVYRRELLKYICENDKQNLYGLKNE